MSSEAPPTYNVSIYIPEYWTTSTTTGFDKTYADNHYLKFPVAQGTEYMTDLVVSGGSTLANTSINGNCTINGLTTITSTNGNMSYTENTNNLRYTELYPNYLYMSNNFHSNPAFLEISNSAVNNTFPIKITSGFDNSATKYELDCDYGLIFSSSTNNSIFSNTNLYLSSLTDSFTQTIQRNYIKNVGSAGSTVISPNSIYTYLVDGATTNFTQITNSGLNITGSTTSLTNANTSTTNLISNTTNNKYIAITSDGTQTSIGTSAPALYLGTVAPTSALTGANVSIFTNNKWATYWTNNLRTQKAVEILTDTDNGGSVKVFGNTSNRYTTIRSDNSPNQNVNSTKLIMQDDNDLFNTSNQLAINKCYMDLVSSNGNAGDGGCVAINLRRTKNVVANDTLGMFRFMGTTTSGTYTEFSRISGKVNNTASGNVDGSTIFYNNVNGTVTTMMEINGDTQDINIFKPLDLNNNSLLTSTGNITIDGTTSSGTGVVNIKTKDNVAGSGTGLTLTGNTLTSGSSTGSSGQHLCLTINGVAYKIALLNP